MATSPAIGAMRGPEGKTRALTRRQVGLGLLACVPVAACQTPPPNVLPALTFDSAPPLPLDVANLVVEDLSAYSPQTAEDLSGEPADSELNEPIADVVSRWARQRFFAIGQSGTARLVIEQATLRRELLARSQGLRGIVTVDQSERFSTRLAVRMVLSDPATARDGFAWASVSGSTTIAENATLAHRQSELFTMVEQAINQLDQTLVAEMRQKVSSFVIR